MTKMIKECKPNPGSEEAGKMGCKCPIYDNEYGRGCGGEFVIRMDCPVHTIEAEEVRKMLGITEKQS